MEGRGKRAIWKEDTKFVHSVGRKEVVASNKKKVNAVPGREGCTAAEEMGGVSSSRSTGETPCFLNLFFFFPMSIFDYTLCHLSPYSLPLVS